MNLSMLFFCTLLLIFVLVFFRSLLFFYKNFAPLSRKRYSEIYEEIERIRERLGINKPVYLKVNSSRLSESYLTNGYVIGRNVILTNTLIKAWNKHPHIVRGILAHEMVHIKYKDNRYRGYHGLLKDLGSKTKTALILQRLEQT
ncbi:M48 family metalloprotease [Metabacillus fastidiosus]|uniref:M48 family metalloprotease n=1 Tax=Metabacillus fastidiosus TaxID=1458 RepID=A0ABU6P413_9BACI|nr:M48 family metalloprotease [Metabacillus fastidiosus]MED4404090.1 M48 family metalloprotease [Metabacillus fastidiosus]